MMIDPNLLVPVEREVRFFLDPFHWLGLFEGTFAPAEVSKWVNRSLNTATLRLQSDDDESFQQWVYDQTCLCVSDRATATQEAIARYTGSNRQRDLDDALESGHAPSPLDAASAAWIDPSYDIMSEGEAIRRAVRAAHWSELESVAGPLPLLLENPFPGHRRGHGQQGSEMYEPYTNVQAARWVNEYRTAGRGRPIGDALQAGAIGPKLLTRSRVALKDHLSIIRSVQVAEWLTRAGSPGRAEYKVKRNKQVKSVLPENLIADIVSRLSGAVAPPSPTTVRRHLERAGMRLPDDLGKRHAD